ncbi:MAG: hypothetical protein JO258_14030 [Alphaproteobacteria bacterium]|nr:hypothetical protein [Alphaproteobacteria bacterium]
MNTPKIKAGARWLAVVAALLPGACFFPAEEPASPLLGTWASSGNNRVTFTANAVVVTPEKGPQTTMSAAECNGRYKLVYGRMQSAALEQSFPSQKDLQAKLKQLLVQPEYPVADVTCDEGGTTYVQLNDRQVLAVYRDAGVGGTENLTRL